MYEDITFGEFIVTKRKARDMRACQLAEYLGISSVYMCDIEKGRKCAVSKQFLETLAATLMLTEEETDLLYDLAAFAQKTISADLPEYVMGHKAVRIAIRTAKKK